MAVAAAVAVAGDMVEVGVGAAAGVAGVGAGVAVTGVGGGVDIGDGVAAGPAAVTGAAVIGNSPYLQVGSTNQPRRCEPAGIRLTATAARGTPLIRFAAQSNVKTRFSVHAALRHHSSFLAQSGRLRTPEEQQACSRDASRFCRKQLGDDGAVRRCLQQGTQLSATCQKVFQSPGMLEIRRCRPKAFMKRSLARLWKADKKALIIADNRIVELGPCILAIEY